MRSIYLNYLRGDLTRNRSVALTLLLVLTLSSFLVTAGTIIMERSSGAVSALFDQAKPPHFLQMHKGSYDVATLEDFASAHSEVESWQVHRMVGFDGADIGWTKADGTVGDFSDSLIDNLFVTQNPEFDFLIDQDGSIPRPQDGTVYLPVAYSSKTGLREGDHLTVRTAEDAVTFRVVGTVKDAQMASSMSSSTRFLISENDFAKLSGAGGGSQEVIVEYRLTDPGVISSFQRDYEANSALPHNGQAVTEVMIRLVNVFSDGIVAIAFILGGLLLVVISLLTVRFMIRSSIESEIRQIGSLKAVGIPDRSISRLFLGRYAVIMGAASLSGGLLAVPAARSLTANQLINFAAPEPTWLTVAAPVVSLLILMALVIWICARMLRAIRKTTVVDALVHGQTTSGSRRTRVARRGNALKNSAGRAINGRLTSIDLRSEWRQWVFLPIVFLIASALVSVPFALLSTFQNQTFATNIGVAPADIRIDIQFAGSAEMVLKSRSEVEQLLASDPSIANFETFGVTRFQTEGEDGVEQLRVEVGNYSGTSTNFVSGAAPTQNQIALSSLNADKYHLSVGDPIEVTQGTELRSLTVSGIYQDVTSGGYTAKLSGLPPTDADSWVIYADVSANADPQSVAKFYDGAAPGVSAVPTGEYMQQSLGPLTDALRSASISILFITLAAITLITTAFLNLRLQKNRRKIGTLSFLGFSAAEQSRQFQSKAVFGASAGVIPGLLIAMTVGPKLVGAALSMTGIGISEVNFLPNHCINYVAIPAALVFIAFLIAVILARKIPRSSPIEWIR